MREERNYCMLVIPLLGGPSFAFYEEKASSTDTEDLASDSINMMPP